MIRYSGTKFCAALRHADAFRLTNFRSAFLVAVFMSCLTAGLVAFDHLAGEPHIRNLDIDVGPYGIITGVLGFILSFRTSQAYSRFWLGAHAVYDMTGGLVMAASSLVAFAHHGDAHSDAIQQFKQTVVRLVSLSSAMMLTELEGVDSLTQTHFHVLGLPSLGSSRVRRLSKTTYKTEVAVQWLKTYVIESLSKGVLSVPAPILTRAFQELDVSVGTYHSADKFAQVPFPFPYVATMDLIMAIHATVTPVVMTSILSSTPFLPIATVFIIVFFFWSIHLIASELENPFNGEMNDLDLEGLQCELNEKLKAICLVQPEDVPRLGVSAQEAADTLANETPAPKRERRRTLVRKLLRGDSGVSVATNSSQRSTRKRGSTPILDTVSESPTENTMDSGSAEHSASPTSSTKSIPRGHTVEGFRIFHRSQAFVLGDDAPCSALDGAQTLAFVEETALPEGVRRVDEEFSGCSGERSLFAGN